jgi:Transmembrane secretion effector
MLYVGYIWLAVCAGGLAILGWLNLLTPSDILGSIFLIGTGFAFNAPVFSAVVPEIVSNEELPSASQGPGERGRIGVVPSLVTMSFLAAIQCR